MKKQYLNIFAIIYVLASVRFTCDMSNTTNIRPDPKQLNQEYTETDYLRVRFQNSS